MNARSPRLDPARAPHVQKMRLIINQGFGIQIVGRYRKGGFPDNLAKIVHRPDAQGNDDEFSSRVDLLQQVVDYWNTHTPAPEVQALVEALERIADLTSHNMGMSARDENCANREARAALAAFKEAGE
jgi:hypothetical protein